jgi:hypothetical protein
MKFVLPDENGPVTTIFTACMRESTSVC